MRKRSNKEMTALAKWLWLVVLTLIFATVILFGFWRLLLFLAQERTATGVVTQLKVEYPVSTVVVLNSDQVVISDPASAKSLKTSIKNLKLRPSTTEYRLYIGDLSFKIKEADFYLYNPGDLVKVRYTRTDGVVGVSAVK